nr:unnamed protein product [Callosobruchus chinensis]
MTRQRFTCAGRSIGIISVFGALKILMPYWNM